MHGVVVRIRDFLGETSTAKKALRAKPIRRHSRAPEARHKLPQRELAKFLSTDAYSFVTLPSIIDWLFEPSPSTLPIPPAS